MAKEFKVKHGLIVDTDVSGAAALTIQGTQGELFTVYDNLEGDIFVISDISSIPIFTVNSDGYTKVDGDHIVSGSLFIEGDGANTGSIYANGQLEIEGDGIITGSLYVSGVTYSTEITGSLFGTASYALEALTASFALNSTTSSYIETASFADNALSASYSLNSTSASHAINANTASYIQYANVDGTPTIGNGTITISAGSGLSGGDSFTTNQTGGSTITLNHADTSGQASSDNSGNTVIQDILLDTYGHITGLTTATISSVTSASYANNSDTSTSASHAVNADTASYVTYANVDGTPTIGDGTLTVSGSNGLTGNNTFTANQVGNALVDLQHADTSTQNSSDNSGNTVIQDITLDGFGHVTGLGTATITTVTNATTASYIATASFSLDGDYATSAAYSENSDTASYIAYANVDGHPTVYAEPGIFSGGGTPTLASGVTGAEVRTLIGAGTGDGSVTLVGGTGTVNGITLTGNVSGSGSITLGGTLGSISNGQLTNSDITIGTTAISLGASSTTLAGLTSVTSTAFVGDLTGNADTATTASYIESASYALNAGTAVNAINVNVQATEVGDTTISLLLVGDQATGYQSPFIDGGLTYNGTTNVLTAGGGFSGNLTGTSSYADEALTSSFAITASYAENAAGGSVTLVGGTGTVNGITLTGAVSGSGSLSLGGTLGSISNGQLTNSSVTIGTTEISLGASSTTLAGLTSVTSTAFVGDLTGNADTADSSTSASYAGVASLLNNANVGGTAQGIYLNSGAATALSATVGSTSQPVYMNSGTITAIAGALGNDITGTASYADEALSASYALTATNVTSASFAVNAGQLDGIDSANFLLSNADDTTTGNLTIQKADATLRLYDTDTSTGTYASVIFDDGNNQGVELYHNELDAELPEGGYGLVVGPSPNNSQWPGTGAITFSVLGEMYTGNQDSGSLYKVYHDNYHPTASYVESASFAVNAGQLDGQDGAAYLRSNATDSASGVISFTNATASTTKDTGAVVITAGGLGVEGAINAGGDIVAYASSDKRLKDNIIPIKNPNEKLKQIRGVTWDWNDNADELQKTLPNVGVVAQEIETVFPQLVRERPDGYKAVDYEKIVALLIESNKELLARIENLEKKLYNK